MKKLAIKNVCGWVQLTDRLTDHHSDKIRFVKRFRADLTLIISIISSFTLNPLRIRFCYHCLTFVDRPTDKHNKKKCLEINMGLPNLADVFSFQLYVKILLFKAF